MGPWLQCKWWAFWGRLVLADTLVDVRVGLAGWLNNFIMLVVLVLMLLNNIFQYLVKYKNLAVKYLTVNSLQVLASLSQIRSGYTYDQNSRESSNNKHMYYPILLSLTLVGLFSQNIITAANQIILYSWSGAHTNPITVWLSYTQLWCG